ncbi:MAG: VOC family protein [Cryobacterium sp.]|nr:VOC family protein [Cryobacterium sp.]
MTQKAIDILAADTAMGAVTLLVADLDLMIGFYRDGVGLDLLEQIGDEAILGRPGKPVIKLRLSKQLRHASQTAAGLYHTAILFESKSDLAAALLSVVRKYPLSYTGSADHFVSNAFYFDDPEGNGVELYWDTARALWEWNQSGIRMGTEWLDPNRFLQDNLTEEGRSAPGDGLATVGHVHLKVGDIATAKSFYVDTVGFEITFEMGNHALFVSAGGYHHHLGMNTWQSAGALARTPALGLGQVSIQVPSRADLGALGERLSSKVIPVKNNGNSLEFVDPWSNQVKVLSTQN